VGGGNLEFQAIAQARERLAGRGELWQETTMRYALGPSLGQCCGGVVHCQAVFIAAGDAIKIKAAYDHMTMTLASKSINLALFGGGHVGKALVRVLGCLPYQITWIDSRGEIFPADVPPNVRCEHSEPVHVAIQDLTPQSQVLIMSFSHAEDLDVVTAALKRLRQKNDLGFIGLIGSKTKWATFKHRLESRGFTAAEIARITCPIGIEGIAGKEPEVVAVSVAAQLLRLRAAQAQPAHRAL
jgi:xanthine dehydrogenase accessory factor